jgi:hypothetical protein
MGRIPSGHAVHVGAPASAASCLLRRQRDAVWLMGQMWQTRCNQCREKNVIRNPPPPTCLAA